MVVAELSQDFYTRVARAYFVASGGLSLALRYLGRCGRYSGRTSDSRTLTYLSRANTGIYSVSGGGGGIPEGALLDESGNPLLTEDGDYIII